MALLLSKEFPEEFFFIYNIKNEEKKLVSSKNTDIMK